MHGMLAARFVARGEKAENIMTAHAWGSVGGYAERCRVIERHARETGMLSCCARASPTSYNGGIRFVAQAMNRHTRARTGKHATHISTHTRKSKTRETYKAARAHPHIECAEETRQCFCL